MAIKHSVSVLAILTALAAPPAIAQVDLSIGGDEGVNVDLDTSDGIEADAQVGNEDGLDVNADVGTGDGGTSVDADVDLGSGDEGDGSVLDTDVNLNAGADDGSLVDLDANADVLEGSGGDEPLVDVEADATVGGSTGGGDLLSLGDGQSDALITLLGDSGLDGVDLDAAIDDTQVAIINVNDVLSEESLADVEVALLSGETAGMDEAQAAVEASITLSSILAGEGLSASDVLAVEVGPEGEASVYVLPGGIESLSVAADADVAGEDVADADVSLLSDDAAASADVSVLPGASEEGSGDDGASATGAAVDAELGLGDSDVADVEADLLSDDDLASADLVILPDDDDDASGAGGGSGSGAGNGTGDADGTTGSGDDGGATGTGDTDSDAAGAGDGASAAGDDGGTATGGASATADVSAVGTMPCPADLRSFLQATATASDIRAASDAEVVVLSGCPSTGLLSAADFTRLRDFIEQNPVPRAAIEAAAGVSFDDVVSASVSGGTVTLYAVEA